MIAQDLARELKVAQLPWRPRRGDLVMDRLNIVYLVIKDGTDEDGAVEIDTGSGVQRHPFLGLTWVPRLDQLLALLARHGAFDLTVRPAAEGRRDQHWVFRLTPTGATEPREFRSTNGADAAAQALHFLLSEIGWRPGPAL